MRAMQTKMVRKKGNSGLTLIEVLVSLLILTSGVAGVAATQTMGLKAVQSSYYRTQADLLLREMADRIRANAGQRDNYGLAFGQLPTVVGSCSGGCVNYDLALWADKVNSNLPLGQSRIVVSPQANGIGPTQLDITILWQDKLATSNANTCVGVDGAVTEGKSELMYCMILQIEV